jgi:hypothetical protein
MKIQIEREIRPHLDTVRKPSWVMRACGNYGTVENMENFLKRDKNYDWQKVFELLKFSHYNNLTTHHFYLIFNELKLNNNSIDCEKVDPELNFFDITDSGNSGGLYSFKADPEITYRFLFKLMTLYPEITFELSSYCLNIYQKWKNRKSVFYEKY